MSPEKSKAWEWHKGALKNLGKCIFFMNCIIGSETSPMTWSVCLFVIRLVGLSVCHNFVKSSTNCPKMYTYANILWNFSYTYLGLTNLENGSNQLLWRWGRSMDGLKKDLSTTEPLATLLFYFFNSTCPCRGMARACPRLLLCMSLAQRQPMTSGKLRLVESVSFANKLLYTDR